MRNKRSINFGFAPILTLAVIICLVFVTGATAVFSESKTVSNCPEIIDGILSYSEPSKDPQKWLDGTLAEKIGFTPEWYAFAARRYYGDLDFTHYTEKLEKYLSENEVSGAVTRQKYALLLVACGKPEHPFVISAADETIGKQGVMSWIFGLHILNNGVRSSSHTVDSVIAKLLELQLDDGGWAIFGTVSDTDVTAMTLQALAPYYKQDPDITSSVDKALSRLSEMQLSNGGYRSFGTENAESTAQVLLAISSLGIDCETDSRFIKEGKNLLDGILQYMLDDGSFCHADKKETNHLATSEVLLSLVSVELDKYEKSPFYIFEKGSVLPLPNNTPDESPSVTPENTPDNTPDNSPEDTHDNTPTASPDSRNHDTDGDNTKTSIFKNYKTYVIAGIVLAALSVALILFLCKKRNFKNYIFIALIAAVLILVTLFTNFRSAESYYKQPGKKENAVGKITMTIRCDTVVGKSDSDFIPADGVILPVKEFEITEGETVYDLLVEAAKTYRIQVEYKSSNSLAYISGINYLYEFDFGGLSGWVFYVNGVSSTVGAGEYKLSDGDYIEWLYTCDLGNDLKK